MKSLYPAEIQKAIFSQLLAYETLLQPEYRFYIERWRDGTILVEVIESRDGERIPRGGWQFIPRDGQTTADLDKQLEIFWKITPSHFKK
jgi:hypothetical protein